jgi:hypothetical protein
MATSRAFARTVYSAIAVLLLLASPDVSFAAGQASCDAPPPHIVVVGSVNIDLTLRVSHPPSLEETVTAIDPRVTVAVGGKGANQAVAAARLVAGSRPVKFVCQFGGDAHASMLEQELVANWGRRVPRRTPPGPTLGDGFRHALPRWRGIVRGRRRRELRVARERRRARVDDGTSGEGRRGDAAAAGGP